MRTTGVEEARSELGSLIDQARLKDEPTLITRYGKPAAVLVGHEWHERARAALGEKDGAAE